MPKKSFIEKKDIIIAGLILLIGFAAGFFTKQYFTKPCPNVFTVKNGAVKDSTVGIIEHSKIETDWHTPTQVSEAKPKIVKVPEYIIWDDDKDSFPVGLNHPMFGQQYYYDTSTICAELSAKYNSLLQKYLTETSYTDTAKDKNVSVIVDNKVSQNKITGQRITIFDSLQKKNIFNIQSFNRVIGYYGITGGWQNANKTAYLGANFSLKLKDEKILGLSAMFSSRLQSLYTLRYEHPIRLFKSKRK